MFLVRGSQRGWNDDLKRSVRRFEFDPGKFALQRGNRAFQGAWVVGSAHGRADHEFGLEMRSGPLIDDEIGIAATEDGVVSIASALWNGEIPHRFQPYGNAPQSIRDLGVAKIAQHTAGNVGT